MVAYREYDFVPIDWFRAPWACTLQCLVSPILVVLLNTNFNMWCGVANTECEESTLVVVPCKNFRGYRFTVMHLLSLTW